MPVDRPSQAVGEAPARAPSPARASCSTSAAIRLARVDPPTTTVCGTRWSPSRTGITCLREHQCGSRPALGDAPAARHLRNRRPSPAEGSSRRPCCATAGRTQLFPALRSYEGRRRRHTTAQSFPGFRQIRVSCACRLVASSRVDAEVSDDAPAMVLVPRTSGTAVTAVTSSRDAAASGAEQRSHGEPANTARVAALGLRGHAPVGARRQASSTVVRYRSRLKQSRTPRGPLSVEKRSVAACWFGERAANAFQVTRRPATNSAVRDLGGAQPASAGRHVRPLSA